MKAADVLVDNQGTIMVLTPQTQEAKDWFDENVEAEGWQWMGDGLAVDHRMAENLLQGILTSGLTVGD